MRTVTVSASKRYDVVIGDGVLDEAGKYALGLLAGRRAAVVTDDIVAPLYAGRVVRSLERAGFEVSLYALPHGERSKNIGSYAAVLDFLADSGIGRQDAVFALGGGVVGDVAGFAASTYMRGVRLVQIPTTLLAAVDSSVGGKTGVDLKAGKNLAGTFYQPDLVLCDCSVIGSLPEEIFRDGLAEVVKYGVIADRGLFDMLRFPARPRLEEIIARCVEIKRDIVESDEREGGARRVLNFGHTVGHAVEALSGYAVPHGRAVAAGMAVVSRAAAAAGVCGENTAREIVELIEGLGLPSDTEYGAKELAKAALSDKKRSGDFITLVLPLEVGRCALRDLPAAGLEEFIGMGLKSRNGGRP